MIGGAVRRCNVHILELGVGLRAAKGSSTDQPGMLVRQRLAEDISRQWKGDGDVGVLPEDLGVPCHHTWGT